MKWVIQNHSLFRWVALIVSLAVWLVFLQTIDRSDFTELMLLFSVLFLAYGLFVYTANDQNALWQGIVAAILFRLLFLPHFPELSDDVYRFIWDGRLLANGIDPFAHLPSYYIEAAGHQPEIPGITPSLFQKLNSPEYFTIYPPVCQSIFALSGWLFPRDITGAVIVIRSFILLFEFGSIYFIYRLQTLNQWPYRTVLLYALNPLVIAELTGNLHFEAGMIFFLLGAFYLLQKGKLNLSALAFAGSVLTKLLPLALLPSLIRRIGLKKALLYGGTVFGITALGFIPFGSIETLTNLFDSINLYFQTFEFNASFYYLARWLGELWVGYNLIDFIGPVLAFTAALLILFYAYLEHSPQTSNWPRSIVIVLAIYLLLSTTVHPWYITPLIAFASLSGFRFPIIWSYLVLLSYGAYSQNFTQMPIGLLWLEYIVIIGMLVWEVFGAHRHRMK